jgi:predicted nucleotidyltransferase component of viral defense system
MNISREKLIDMSQATGFRPEILEKVAYLLHLLEAFNRHPSLKGRWALKGGTAINLFLFDVSRLSVDIDLNYIGEADREAMMADRPRIDQGIQAVCSREGMTATRVPTDHAGGKWRLHYIGALGGGGNLEIDLNYLYRVPLWPVTLMDANVGPFAARKIPVLDRYELAAGKFAALFSRQASRDLFDAHHLLTQQTWDRDALRLAFVLYGAMNRKDWRTVSIDEVGCDPREVENQLIPVIRDRRSTGESGRDWVQRLISECRKELSILLPMTSAELGFLDQILDHGRIEPERLTSDSELADRIRRHPLLQWKAQNVQKHKKP